MAHAMMMPVAAGLSLIGVAAGVNLGRATIADINPAYFTEPDTVFHADLVPYRGPDWAQVQVAEYQQAQVTEGLGTGCIGCRDYPEEYYPQPEPAVDGYSDGWSASAAAPPAELEPVEPAPREEWVRVERYASYPVSAEEAEAAPATDEGEAPSEEDYASSE